MACKVCGNTPEVVSDAYLVEHCARCLDDARALARLRKWRAEQLKHLLPSVLVEIDWDGLSNVSLKVQGDQWDGDGTTLAAAVDAALKAWEERG